MKDKTQPKHTSHQETGVVLDSKTKTQRITRKQKVDQLSEVDHVPTNTRSSHNESHLYLFKDNEAVIKMIIKGRSPTMRHVSRTHRVALDWLFDRINLEPKIKIKYVETKNQLADILAKGSLSEMSGITLCVCSTSWTFRHILAAIWHLFFPSLQSELCLVPCRSEDKTRLRVTALQWQRQDPPIW